MNLEEEMILENLARMSLQVESGVLCRNMVNETRVYNQMELKKLLDQRKL